MADVRVTMEADASGFFEPMDRAANTLDEVASRSRDVGTVWRSAFADMEQAAADTAVQTDRMSESMDRMSSGGSKATQILFSAGDAAQDAQFGFAGAANNITFMAEQFSELTRETGGARAAMMTVVRSLTGVGGIMLAIQALMIVAPRLIEWFNSSEEAAKEASDAFSKFANDVISVESEFSDIEFEPVSPERAREILAFASQFAENEERRIEKLERAVELRQEANGYRDLAARQQLEFLGLEDQSRYQLEQSLAASKERLATVQAIVARLREQEDLSEEDVRFKKMAHLFGLDIKETEEETTEAAEEGNKRLDRRLQAMQTLGVVANQVGNNLRNVRLQGLSGDIAFAGRVLEQGLGQSINQVETAIARLNEELAKAGGPQQRERIRALIAELKSLRSEMTATKDEAILTGQQVKGIASDAMIDGFMQLGRAIGEGESIIESFGQAAKQILSQIASQIAQILIAQGTGMLLSGNPAGAALIAAGVALQASAAALTSGGGGGGRGRGGRGARRRQRQSGGEAGIDVPGRRTGGPVRAGSMYETHGLGQREFFVPQMPGSIMTQGQMMSQRVDVGVSLEGGTVRGDLWEIEAELREVSRTKDRIARQ